MHGHGIKIHFNMLCRFVSLHTNLYLWVCWHNSWPCSHRIDFADNSSNCPRQLFTCYAMFSSPRVMLQHYIWKINFQFPTTHMLSPSTTHTLTHMQVPLGVAITTQPCHITYQFIVGSAHYICIEGVKGGGREKEEEDGLEEGRKRQAEADAVALGLAQVLAGQPRSLSLSRSLPLFLSEYVCLPLPVSHLFCFSLCFAQLSWVFA